MYEPYYEYDPDYEIIVRYDTIVCYNTLYVSTLEEVTRLFNLSFDEFAKQLLDKIAETEQDSLTAEQLYLNYLLPMRFPSQVNQRYIVRNYQVEAKEEQVHLHPQDLTFPTGVFQDSLQLDLLVTFRGDTETDRFLASSSLRASCLEQLFVAVDNFPNHAIKGVNFYFPDYSFRKKRSMAQFMKSASLVIDSCRLESIRDIRLYATFDREKGDRHRSYLYTLTQMTDSVMLVNSRSDEWPRQYMEILRKEDALRTNFLLKCGISSIWPVTIQQIFRKQMIKN
ncbi:MAG: hypothetical protein LUE93_15185 [Bacteroides sp.]|nr:hypothetical protein [Bacteroides sp.]